MQSPDPELLKKLFVAIDKGNKGYVVLEDVVAALSVLPVGPDIARIWKWFQNADKDHDQKLSLDEFLGSYFAPVRVPLTVTSPVQKIAFPPPKETGTPHPVLIVPGMIGSGLTYNGHRVWLPRPGFEEDDFVVVVLLLYNALKIEVRSLTSTQPMEGLTAVEYLDDKQEQAYFNDVVTDLKNNGISVDAAPYDWRLVPQKYYMDTWLETTKESIRNLHKDKKVFILAHSMGNLMSLYLFSKEKQFVSEHIEGYIAVCPPYGGAGMTVSCVVDEVQMPGIPQPLPMLVSQNLTSLFWMFPNSLVYKEDNIFTDEAGKPHTHDEFVHSYLKNTYPKVHNLHSAITGNFDITKVEQPEVPVYLFTARGEVPAIIGHDLSAEGEKRQIFEPPGEKYGDGTVPYRSAHAFDGVWTYAEEYELYPENHNDILHKDTFLGKLIDIVKK